MKALRRMSKAKLEDFAKNTTIHGFRELFARRSMCGRILWSVCLILSFVGLAIETSRTVREFLTYPTAMRAITFRMNHYPSATFCTNQALSVEIANRVAAFLDTNKGPVTSDSTANLSLNPMVNTEDGSNLTEGEESYDSAIAATFEPTSRDFLAYIISHWTFVTCPNMASYDCDLSVLHLALKKVLDGSGSHSLTYLLDRLTLSPENVFVLEDKEDLIEVTKNATPIHGCYHIRFERSDVMHMAEPRVNIVLRSNTLAKNILERRYGIDYAYKLAFGDPYTTKQHFIQLRPESNYDILLKVQQHRRINTHNDPCIEANISMGHPHRQVCSKRCFSVAMIQCFNCSTYSGYLPPKTPFCSFLDTQRFIQNDPVVGECTLHFTARVKECQKGCMSHCNSWKFESSIIPTESTEQENTSRISIRLMEHLSSILWEEHYIYSFGTLVSNMGGMVSLFCGASIISVFQCFYWLCCNTFSRRVEHRPGNPLFQIRRRELNDTVRAKAGSYRDSFKILNNRKIRSNIAAGFSGGRSNSHSIQHKCCLDCHRIGHKVYQNKVLDTCHKVHRQNESLYGVVVDEYVEIDDNKTGAGRIFPGIMKKDNNNVSTKRHLQHHLPKVHFESEE